MNPFGEYLKKKSSSPRDEIGSSNRQRGRNRSRDITVSSTSSDLVPRDSPPPAPHSNKRLPGERRISPRPQSPQEIVEPQVKKIAMMMKRFRESPPRSRKERSESWENENSREQPPINRKKSRRRKQQGASRRSSLWKETLNLENGDENDNYDENDNFYSQEQEDEEEYNDDEDILYEDPTISNSSGLFFMDEELEAERTLANNNNSSTDFRSSHQYKNVVVVEDDDDENNVAVRSVQKRLQQLFKKRGIEDVDLSFDPTKSSSSKKNRKHQDEEEEEEEEEEELLIEEEHIDEENFQSNLSQSDVTPDKILKSIKLREHETEEEDSRIVHQKNSPHIPRYKYVTEEEDNEEENEKTFQQYMEDEDNNSISSKKNDSENISSSNDDLIPLYRQLYEEELLEKKKNKKEKNEESFSTTSKENDNDYDNEQMLLFERINFFIQNSIDNVLLEQEIKNHFKFKVEHPRFSELKKFHSFGCVEGN